VFIEAKDDGGGGVNCTGAVSRAKLQSNHHHQQTNIQYVGYVLSALCLPVTVLWDQRRYMLYWVPF